MRLFNTTIALALLMANTTNSMLAQTDQKQILFSYSDFYPKSVSGYTYLVIEPYFFSTIDVTELKKNNDRVFAYISVGEVDKGSWFYKDLKDFSIGKNPIWDSEIITLANDETKKVLHQLVDYYITEKGFNGIFLDNVDNYTIYGPTPDHTQALVSFLREINQKYPHIQLMQNAGVEIIDKTASLINILAIESIATNYNFKTNTYKLRDTAEFNERANQVNTIQKTYQLPIIAIEYANTHKLRDKVIKRLKHWDWLYFIGQIELRGKPVFLDK